jgi:hypothetical protein
MPVGRLSLRHALIGAISAALLWEISRDVLVATLSQVSVVYGSLTTAIAVLGLDGRDSAFLTTTGSSGLALRLHLGSASGKLM